MRRSRSGALCRAVLGGSVTSKGGHVADNAMGSRAFRWWARAAVFCSTLLVMLGVEPAVGREPGDPIRLEWVEGDMAGLTGISAPDGAKTIGFVQYRQHRKGDVLEI